MAHFPSRKELTTQPTRNSKVGRRCCHFGWVTVTSGGRVTFMQVCLRRRLRVCHPLWAAGCRPFFFMAAMAVATPLPIATECWVRDITAPVTVATLHQTCVSTCVMHTDMCTDMYTDMCTDMCTDMNTDASIDMRSDMCICICVSTRLSVCILHLCIDMPIDMCFHINTCVRVSSCQDVYS